jgi:hypothetical protein
MATVAFLMYCVFAVYYMNQNPYPILTSVVGFILFVYFLIEITPDTNKNKMD